MLIKNWLAVLLPKKDNNNKSSKVIVRAHENQFEIKGVLMF
jgi:hypothetical protein